MLITDFMQGLLVEICNDLHKIVRALKDAVNLLNVLNNLSIGVAHYLQVFCKHHDKLLVSHIYLLLVFFVMIMQVQPILGRVCCAQATSYLRGHLTLMHFGKRLCARARQSMFLVLVADRHAQPRCGITLLVSSRPQVGAVSIDPSL